MILKYGQRLFRKSLFSGYNRDMRRLLDMISVHFLSNKVLRILFLLGLFLFVVSFVFIILKVNMLSLPVILHFDAFNGVDKFGDQSSVWGVWGLGFVFFLLNSVLGEVFFLRERALTFVFLGTNLLFSILFLIIISVIITIN